MEENKEIIKQINDALEKIRPFIQKDGGDIEFCDFIDGVVYLKMHGACADCMFVDDTISNGVELILQEEVPGVTKVEVLR